MSLNKDQVEKLRKLVAEGKTLSEIQSELEADNIRITYMELRFLVDDLGLMIAEKEKQKTVPPMGNPSSTNVDAPTADDGEKVLSPSDVSVGSVSVSIDAVMRPGTLVSGQTTFSDGVNVQWTLDQFGRLGLVGAPQGYQPSQADLAEFQKQLREMLEARGGI